MKKILLSLAMIGVVASLGVGATSAIFSDDEVSTGNTFTAGAVDLTVDNESYYNGALNEGTTWLEARDLDDGNGPADDGGYYFFNFDDVKPGDWGSDAISLHVNNNDSWACVDVTLRSDDDNGLTEPEADDGDATAGVGEGELADAINFIWWADDGDVVLEDDEILLPAGPLGNLDVDETATVALADSSVNIWGDDSALPGDSVRYLGKAWCLGEMTIDPVAQDGVGNTASSTNGPLVRGDGYTCNGAAVDNVTQTDSMSADIAFHVEQSRHNGEFVCEALPQETTITVTKVVDNSLGGDAEVSDFTLLVDALEVTSGVGQTILPGDYTVTETGSTTGYSAVFSGDCDANGDITIAEFDQASCTITNTFVPSPATTTIDKIVQFSNQSLAVNVGDFDLFIDNGDGPIQLTDETPMGGLLPGTYTVSEVYTGSESISVDAQFSGACTDEGDTGTLILAEDDDVTCTITNIISEAI